jgi:hypothetical protein
VSVFSGSSSTVAVIAAPDREICSAFARSVPSTMTWIAPLGALAIWRIAAIVPIGLRSPGSGSSRSPFCSDRNNSRSPASARLIDSMETGRLMARGWSVCGKTTVCRSARTGSSLG